MNNLKQKAMELRKECQSLIKVADGLIDIIRKDEACNLSTMARMATEARAMASKLASEIERIYMGEVEKVEKPTIFSKLKKIVLDFAMAVFCY